MLKKVKNIINSLLIVGLFFSISSISAQVIDTDGDGVSDALDLCPETASGTQVNTYGCPINVVNCDYNSSSFTFVSGSKPTTVNTETRYVLAAANDGKILQISDTPTFTDLIGSKTYMVLAYSYQNDGTTVNLRVGSFLNQVSSSCGDWSKALSVKVCVPFVETSTCDYTSSSITLKSVGSTPTGVTTKYFLINKTGSIVKLSDTPTFTGLSGINTFNAYALSYTGTINNLTLGSNISSIAGTCLDFSSPLSIKVCVCNPVCIPVSITRIK
jgi:hypothetical protein